MANEEHLDILSQGVEVWNKWRKENQWVTTELNGIKVALNPDLRNADLSGRELRDIDFGRVDLLEADISNANLINANFKNANIEKCDFNSAFLLGADFFETLARQADFRKATLAKSDISYSYFEDADLSDSEMFNSSIKTSNFSNVKFCRAKLQLSSFLSVDLYNSDFSESIMGSTIFGDIDFRSIKGLDEVYHEGPSILGIASLLSSKGEIPRQFLTGAGIPENIIDYFQSLSKSPFQFFSCFISYNENEDQLSKRLYDDLRSEDIRCWRWREDAKMGHDLMSSIDKAIRFHDKVIVVCSENSLKSPAVIREIERAIQKEDEIRRKGQVGEVLFPIRVDDFIFEKWEHHRKPDVVAKYVGDFRNWKDPSTYEEEFNRLVEGLTKED